MDRNEDEQEYVLTGNELRNRRDGFYTHSVTF
jgi:hypothetical protein